MDTLRNVRTRPRPKHPYSLLGRFYWHPWRWTLTKPRYIRFMIYSALAFSPVIYFIDRGVNTQSNAEFWDRKRKARQVDHWAPPNEFGPAPGGH